MSNFRIILLILVTFFSFNVYCFPIPKDGKIKFDIIRKNKVIGSHEIKFTQKNDLVFVETNINIDVKILFISAYKFSHQSKETWKNKNFIEIDGYSDFEDEREYFIKGYEKNNVFFASGMDGELELSEKILPSNVWNIKILNEKEVFDTQKGIVRTIEVSNEGDEKIIINNKQINCEKYTLNASTNPKDKAPFPEYTLWYSKSGELMKFQFISTKDNKLITIIRNLHKEN